jgi:malonate decarboxylase delta subunit
MALQNLEFVFDGGPGPFPREWSHTGVVGSGDMEVLIRREKLGGKVKVKVVTPVSGFDAIWEKVLGRFVAESGLGDVTIEINDNNSTPFIVATRLKQAVLEAEGGGAL